MPPPASLGRLGEARRFTGRRDEAMARMERAFEVISADEPDEDLALLAARLVARLLVQRRSRARGRAGRAGARHRRGACVPCGRSRSRCARKRRVAYSRGHTEEAGALLKRALEIALEHDLADEARHLLLHPLRPVLPARPIRRRARTTSTRRSPSRGSSATGRTEWAVLAERTYPLYMLGRWDEALATSDEFTAGADRRRRGRAEPAPVGRRDPPPARRARRRTPRLLDVRAPRGVHRRPGALQLPGIASLPAPGRRATAARRSPTARRRSRRAARFGIAHQAVKQGFVEALEAAFALGEAAKIEELLALDRGRSRRAPGRRPRRPGQALPRPPRRRRRGLRGRRRAVPRARHPLLARGHPARARRADRRRGRPLLAEAREIFERLEATPWLERVVPSSLSPAGGAGVTCASCGTENREGPKFCAECGTPLARGCPSCGAANEPGEKFCGECGADARRRADGAAARRPPRRCEPSGGSSPSSSPTSSASRRSRRAATPRRCASSSPATSTPARQLIERYGGTVEKFIGDAVMAVWGTPVGDGGRRRAGRPRRARPGRAVPRSAEARRAGARGPAPAC